MIVLLSLTLLFTAASRPATAHKFHASFMTINYNKQERAAEITMRFFPGDLQAALAKQNKKAVRLDKSREVTAMILDYLRRTFTLKKGERPPDLRWVDMDLGADNAYMYLTAKLPEGLSGARLRNQFLFDLFDDQVNVVTIKYEDRQAELVFRKEEGDLLKSVP